MEDRHLVESGKIPAKYLFTIRQLEPSFDNIADRIIPAETDILKIKAQKERTSCVFFDETASGCRIYENRPIECRVLKCWDTREISRIYAVNRLTRKDLIAGIDGLWDLIQDHQDRCSYKKITLLSQDAKEHPGKSPAMKMLTEIIAYDTNIRPLIIKQAGMDSEMLEFLFGRPLSETIAMFGFKMKNDRPYKQ